MEILTESLRLNPDLVREKAKEPGLKKWLQEEEELRLRAEQNAFRSLGGDPKAAVDALDLQDSD